MSTKKILSVVCTLMLLISCGRQLTKQAAEVLLRKVYTKDNDPDEMGGTQVDLKSIQVDSIRQQGDTALVFYKVSGSASNGSAYQTQLDDGEQQDNFERNFWGSWKEKEYNK